MAWRLDRMGKAQYRGLTHVNDSGEYDHGPRWTGETRLVEGALTQPLHWRKPRRIFVCSMSDLFHESVPDKWIASVFGVMAASPRHTFQVLTKRPERMREWFAWVARDPSWLCYGPSASLEDIAWCDKASTEQRRCIAAAVTELGVGIGGGPTFSWPLPNVWLGTTCEDQRAADERIPHLLATPAAVRFVSVEPMIGPVDLTDITIGAEHWDALSMHEAHEADSDGPGTRLDWVIVGGESGQGARLMDPQWARDVRDQCAAAGVSYFFKQWGGHPKIKTRLLDGAEHNEMPGGGR
jgi:protein gp37